MKDKSLNDKELFNSVMVSEAASASQSLIKQEKKKISGMELVEIKSNYPFEWLPLGSLRSPGGAQGARVQRGGDQRHVQTAVRRPPVGKH